LSTRPNPETFNSLGAFFEVKVANVLTAVELSKRSKGALNAYSLSVVEVSSIVVDFCAHFGSSNRFLFSLVSSRSQPYKLFANLMVLTEAFLARRSSSGKPFRRVP
jgi:hypothetical protein